MDTKIGKLKDLLMEINDLEAAASLLSWDQLTYMPPGGAVARGRQIATLKQIAHQKYTDPVMEKLLEELRPLVESLPYDSDEASLVRVTARDFEKALKVPADFMAEFYNHTAVTYEAWAQAREKKDFQIVRPYLEKSLDLSLKYANFYAGYEHIADPLIDMEDEGVKVATILPLFHQLRRELIPMVQAITSQPLVDSSCLEGFFPEKSQIDFGINIIKRFGFDFERGRQDRSIHPFTIEFSTGDVRITTRVKENNLNEALFSTMHESGHAMYEQGISAELEGTPLAKGTSSGVHESQSRLWENLVGRSLDFWEYFYPELQEVFPEQLGKVSLESFYKAINKVERSLIRTDADEVTYNLHVMLRFDFELALLEGKLKVKDLPEAWVERFRQDFGIIPQNPNEGVLQDMHWYSGPIGGAFQGYTLGNILSAQFFEAAVSANPSIKADMKKGEFGGLHGWLKENIYQYGSKYLAEEIVKKATHQPMTIEPYIRYLRTKYGKIYQL